MASSVDAKLLKSTKFPSEFNQKVDMQKVNLEVMKKWIAGRISDILGNDDDVVIELCFNLIDGTRYPDIKKLQIQLTGFLDKETAGFCKELWKLCLSAQSNPQGVPKELLEAKKLELIQEKIEAEKAAEDARRRREDDSRRDRDVQDLRQRERGGRNDRGGRDDRGRGGGGGRGDSWRGGRGGDRAFDRGSRGSLDRRDLRVSRSPPPARRGSFDRAPRVADTYVPAGRGQRRKSRSVSRSRSLTRSDSGSTPPRRRRSPTLTRSISPVPRRRRSPTPTRSISPAPRRRRSRSRSTLQRGSYRGRGQGRNRSPQRSSRRRSPSVLSTSRSRSPPRKRRRSPSSSRSRSPAPRSRRSRYRSSSRSRSPSRLRSRSRTTVRPVRAAESTVINPKDTDDARANPRSRYRRDERRLTRSRSKSRTRSPPVRRHKSRSRSRSRSPIKSKYRGTRAGRDRQRRRPIEERYDPSKRQRKNSLSVSAPDERRARRADSPELKDRSRSQVLDPATTTAGDGAAETKTPQQQVNELRERLLKEKIKKMRTSSISSGIESAPANTT